jgi:hypothetical protein
MHQIDLELVSLFRPVIPYLGWTHSLQRPNRCRKVRAFMYTLTLRKHAKWYSMFSFSALSAPLPRNL